jgi:pimeloyl-ACP methyl ester carboxylesterase
MVANIRKSASIDALKAIIKNAASGRTKFYMFCIIILYSGCSVHREKTSQQSFNIFKSVQAKKIYLKSYDKTLESWPVKFTETMVPTHLGQAHVITCGDEEAPPLILLHGLNASSTMWYANVKDLTSHYHIFAIDFILEPGKSVPVKGELSRDEILEWYEEIFAHFNLKKYSIVGASRGGWLALALALKPDTKIDKLVLLSPAQSFTSIPVKKKIFENISFAFFPRKTKLKKVLSTLSTHQNQLDKSYVNQFYVASRYAKINKSLFQMKPFSEEELHSIKIPVMVLIGDHDIINNEKGLEKAQSIPHVKTETLTDAGHFLSFDQSTIVDQKIIKFLEGRNQ